MKILMRVNSLTRKNALYCVLEYFLELKRFSNDPYRMVPGEEHWRAKDASWYIAKIIHNLRKIGYELKVENLGDKFNTSEDIIGKDTDSVALDIFMDCSRGYMISEEYVNKVIGSLIHKYGATTERIKLALDDIKEWDR